MDDQRYTWHILQRGAIPLNPDTSRDRQIEHRCTATLIWPADSTPAANNSVLVDPCFTDAGYEEASQALATLGVDLNAVGRVFITHLHGDHMLHLPYHIHTPRFRSFRPESLRNGDPLAGLTPEPCPGHDHGLLALAFRDVDDRAVWVVGDAVLDTVWLHAWAVYYPNGYDTEETITTWRSLARILAHADVVIPGHGPAFDVTPELLRALLESFPDAPFADRCPDVAQTLEQRLATLESRPDAESTRSEP